MTQRSLSLRRMQGEDWQIGYNAPSGRFVVIGMLSKEKRTRHKKNVIMWRLRIDTGIPRGMYLGIHESCADALKIADEWMSKHPA